MTSVNESALNKARPQLPHHQLYLQITNTVVALLHLMAERVAGVDRDLTGSAYSQLRLCVNHEYYVHITTRQQKITSTAQSALIPSSRLRLHDRIPTRGFCSLLNFPTREGHEVRSCHIVPFSIHHPTDR
eukprot:8137198-Pyramimonas_sp.AAC.1